jgi:AhpD family alkylhydroperoxidase
MKRCAVTEVTHPKPSKALTERPRVPAPEINAAFHQLSDAVFRDGALPRKAKRSVAVAVAHVTQCPYCIQSRTKAATRDGATPEEIMGGPFLRFGASRDAA